MLKTCERTFEFSSKGGFFAEHFDSTQCALDVNFAIVYVVFNVQRKKGTTAPQDVKLQERVTSLPLNNECDHLKM